MRCTIPVFAALLILLPALQTSAEPQAHSAHLPCFLFNKNGNHKETVSPSGRYALGWGMRGRYIDWDRLDGAETPKAWDYLCTFVNDDKHLENYIIDCKTQRIVSRVPIHFRGMHDEQGKWFTFTAGGDFWIAGGGRKNHADLSTYWLKDESMAILFYDGKWRYDAIYIATRQGDQFHEIEVGDQIERYIRRYLDRTQHRAYQKAHQADERDPYVEASDFRLTQDSLTLHIESAVPKDIKERFIHYSGTIKLHLTHSRDGLRAQIVSLQGDSSTKP